MVLKSIPQVQTGDRNTNQMQSNIINPLNQLFKNPILSGQYVYAIDLVTGDNDIQTNLGYTLTGYLVVMQDAAASIYYVSSTNDTLTLNSSGSVTVTLYVF